MRAFFSCATSQLQGAEGSLRQTELADGTRRLTASTFTLHDTRAPIPSCERLEASSLALRQIVDRSSQRVLGALEPLIRTKGQVLASLHGGWYASLGELALHGEQLEHFHAYTRREDNTSAGALPPQPPSAEQSLPMHTDGGLLLAMLPALHMREHTSHVDILPPPYGENGTSGFRVQLADGSMAAVDHALAGSSLLYLVGDGWRQWLTPQLSRAMRAAPHSMSVLPSNHEREGATEARLWYGRMYLPPEDALLPGENRSFAELRASEERAAGVTRWANNVSNENVRPSFGLEAVSRRHLVDK
ncbi:MAG: hypothetical protein SGPRY_009772, partial [Prymnesium sp.]